MSSGSEQHSGPSPHREKKWGRPPNLVCDGTVSDYRRHYRRRERPCPESRLKWREYYTAENTRARALKRAPKVRIPKRQEIVYPPGKENSALYRLGILKADTPTGADDDE